jgi:hypothetical protein
MDSLYYDGFDYRKESLDGPQPQTFEWIFDAAEELVIPKEDSYDWPTEKQRHLVWPSFPRWLESADSSSQYCILGKAGSGKSTLMAWISRDQQEQTVSHLRKWADSRPVHVVTHFLFRPSVNALGRNLEGLLRSLLFQVLSAAPDVQTSVFDGHGAQNHGPPTTRWPIRALKQMLKRALHSAQQHVFCIFIDGVDEFQNEGDAKDSLDSLIDYLLELQQPEHIKLCFSSRPTVRKLSYLAGISGTALRLADLNRLDIFTYVSQVIYRCDGLRDPDMIVHEVCQRADGVFLWAVFAVQELSKWADTEELSMLLERLERMGTQLEEIFAYMLHNFAQAHRKTLAFYVKAMKWSRMGPWEMITSRPSVVLLVAAQEDISDWTYKTLVERCELEERRITQWSHGLLEITTSSADAQSLTCDYAWVPRTSQDVQQGQQRSVNGTKELPTDWIVAEFDRDGQRVAFFNRRRISWLHRSAFDFFFSPTGQSHTQQTGELLDRYNDRDIPSALIRGSERLMLTLPHACTNPCSACLVLSFQSQARQIIQTAVSANELFGGCHDAALDQLLATLLAWKHHGPHLESVSDYHTVFRERELTSNYCPFMSAESVQKCMKDNCFVRLHLGTLRRDHTTEQVSLKNDACSSLRGTLSEVMFWKLCVLEKVCPSYTIPRCATLHRRRAGGVILACILESMHTDPRCEPLADEMRLVAHVRDQIQLWFNRHASAPDTSASRWINILTAGRVPGSGQIRDDTIVSCLSIQTRGLTPGQDVSTSETTSHDVENDNCSEKWMVSALASIFANRRYRPPRHELCLQLNQILAPWDICVNISRRRDVSLAVMIHVTELARINHTIFMMDHIDVASLRLMLGDHENGRMASHWISRDIARRMCKHCMEYRKSSMYPQRILELDRKAFLYFAEDLLQDVHQNPILLATEKTALENALCIPLVDHAKCKAMGFVIPPSYSWLLYQELGHRLSVEEAEKVDCAGQAEQARLMALLSDRQQFVPSCSPISTLQSTSSESELGLDHCEEQQSQPNTPQDNTSKSPLSIQPTYNQ